MDRPGETRRPSAVEEGDSRARRRIATLVPDGAFGRLVSRNVVIAGRRTSMRLEPTLWRGLAEIAAREGMSVNDLCTAVAAAKDPRATVTGATRTFVASYFRDAATEEGHRAAGHGGWTADVAGLPARPPRKADDSKA